MNKKFVSLGTALSRDEAKRVMGGDEGTISELGDGSEVGACGSTCSGSCTIKDPGGDKAGKCALGRNDKCYCVAAY